MGRWEQGRGIRVRGGERRKERELDISIPTLFSPGDAVFNYSYIPYEPSFILHCQVVSVLLTK